MVKLKDEISKVLQSIIFTEDDRDLQEVTGQMLSDRRLTLSIAESCTGGLISKLFTDQPGSSAFLLGGVIAYHNDLKMDLLKVSAETLENVGAVSEETAKAMALNIREITGSDFAISTTGISGPGGGTEDKPVGLVYIGMSDANGVIVKKFNFLKTRKLHREMTAATAINMLRLLLLEKYSTT
jgi:nicotinamide-nucleotide amidase